VCVREGERERVCVYVCCQRKWSLSCRDRWSAGVHVCVCVCEREGVYVFVLSEFERRVPCSCVRVCVFVCVRVYLEFGEKSATQL